VKNTQPHAPKAPSLSQPIKNRKNPKAIQIRETITWKMITVNNRGQIRETITWKMITVNNRGKKEVNTDLMAEMSLTGQPPPVLECGGWPPPVAKMGVASHPSFLLYLFLIFNYFVFYLFLKLK
jgi:hypothetical protein